MIQMNYDVYFGFRYSTHTYQSMGKARADIFRETGAFPNRQHGDVVIVRDRSPGSRPVLKIKFVPSRKRRR